MHNDEPALLDVLERGRLIEEVGESIAGCTPPQVFGVHGDWGLGKTSFLHQVQWYLTGDCPQQPQSVTDKMKKSSKIAEQNAPAKIRKEYKAVVQAVWFDAWRYQNDAAPIVALLHEMRAQLSWGRRVVRSTGRHTKVAMRGALLSMEEVTKKIGLQYSKFHQANREWETENLAAALPSHTLREHLRAAVGQLLPSKKSGLPSPRLVVFIDDVDRCEPGAAYRLLEGLKIYLTLDNCVFVLGVCRIWHTVSDKIRARSGECREFTMSDPFKPVDRDTPYLLPPSLQDWLPQEHLARFVVEIVDRLDLSELERAYGGRGKTPYHPAVMVALLFYGYATGVFSSRKLELATYDSVAFRYITADTHPDHDTIAHFRKRFLEPLRGLFVQILVIAQAMGVLKIGTVSLDGTKVKANASKHKAMSWGYANRLEAQLREEVKTLLEQAARADTEASPGLDIPEELERREARLAAIERAKAEIERRALKRYEAEQAEYEEKLKRRRDTEKATGKKARGREPKAPEPGPRAKDQVNFTDEESRIMPSSEGFVQGYNAQAAVDIDSHVIVAEHVSDHTNDKQELAPALRCLDERQEVVGQPRALLADAGYFSDENVKRCEAEGIEPYIASGRERHHRPLADRLAPVPERPAQADGVAAMGHRMKTPEGRALYAKRKSTVETVFGVIKEVMGFRRFHLRGLEAVQGEWALVCMAWNLKRMHVAVA